MKSKITYKNVISMKAKMTNPKLAFYGSYKGKFRTVFFIKSQILHSKCPFL